MKRAKQRIARTSENVRMLNELEVAEALSAMGRRFVCAWEKGKRKFAATGGYDTPDEVIKERLIRQHEAVDIDIDDL